MEFPLLETLGPEQELTRVSPFLETWALKVELTRIILDRISKTSRTDFGQTTTTTTTKRLEMRRSSLITFLLLQPVLHFPVPTKHHLNLT